MASLGEVIFGAVVRARARAYASGRLGVARLPAPVISVGNLSVGGSGKTPTVITLGLALQGRGFRLDVLTRGYGRRGRGLEVAETGAEDFRRVGDEPLLIARRLRAPVMVHPDRFRSGLAAERRFGSQLHLLDDGFQHRSLARAFDLVLVSPRDLDDRLLPVGRLREPPAALERASALLWVNDWQDAASELALARRRLAPFSSAPVFLARKRAPPAAVSARRPYAFCGLARPESFWTTLAALGIVPSGRRAFRDHHRYTRADLRRLRAAAQAAGADGFVTTAKDAVKLPENWENLEVVAIEMEIPELEALTTLAAAACGL